MKPRRSGIVAAALIAAVVGSLANPLQAPAQEATVVRAASREIIEAVGRYLGRSEGRALLTQELESLGGDVAVREVSQRVVSQGGDAALKDLVRAADSYGPDAIRAAKNADSIPRILEVVDELPDDVARQAVHRLASSEGTSLARATEKFGADALRAEVRHPGVGGRLVESLGHDGATLAAKTSNDEAVEIGRRIEELIRLPAEQRTDVVKALVDHTDGMTSFMQRFVQQNPGKVLFTTATTSLLLLHMDDVLGGGSIVIGPDGKPVFIAKPGLIERLLAPLLRPLKLAVWLIALVASGLIVRRLWLYMR